MIRHYIEGLALSLVAMGAYIYAIKQNKWLWAVLGSVFYLLATLAKEIYVPLFIVLVFLPIATIRVRIRWLIPYLLVVILYIILRTYMLGFDFVINSQPYNAKTTWQSIWNFPNTYIDIMGWQAIWQKLSWLCVAIGLVIAMLRRPFSLGLSCVVWFSVVFIPLIPIIGRLSIWLNYYLFLFGLLLALGYGIAFKQLTGFLTHSFVRHFVIMGSFLILLLANFLSVETKQAHVQKIGKRQKIQGEFLLHTHLPETTLIYRYNCAASLIYLREKVLNYTSGMNWCKKNNCVCQALYPEQTAWSYKKGQGQWNQMKMSMREFEECGQPAEFSVVLKFKPPTGLKWHLGPYTIGKYYLLTTLDTDANFLNGSWKAQRHWKTGRFVMIPPQGEHIYSQAVNPPIKVIVKYVSPEGWETFSPLFELEPNQVNSQGLVELNWRRSEKHILNRSD